MSVWILVEKGLTGTLNQCLGVADALGVNPVVKSFTLRQPWKTLTPYINWGIECGIASMETVTPAQAGVQTGTHVRLDGEDWPEILICAGRKAVGLALWVKRQSPKTQLVCLQDPRAHHAAFDLIAVPAHDPARGPNVLVTTATPNRITPQRLAAAHAKWQPTLADLHAPRVAVLIGGKSRAHDLTPAGMATLSAQLRNLAQQGYGLMVTASRRTGDANRKTLETALADTDAYIWDGQGDNPYDGFLAWADAILVTSDSASMVSEAATTCKPVYRIDLAGGSPRFAALHALLDRKGITRPFTGTIESWTYTPLHDAADIATVIRAAR